MCGVHYPKEIVALCITKIYEQIKISCGYLHTILMKDTHIYVFGSNYHGELGFDRTIPEKKYPTKLLLRKTIELISCGDKHSIALIKNNELSSNKLYVWGNNEYGQLGIDNKIHNKLVSPRELELNSLESKIVSIKCGRYHTFILTQLGTCYSWGANDFGQFGVGNNKHQYIPQKINLLDIIEIDCGSSHSVALNKYNKCYAWGCNTYGQLGVGGYGNKNLPCEICLSDIITIRCGGYHMVALTKYKKIYVWGNNASGQLGLGHFDNKRLPQELILDFDVKAISCGETHTVALTHDRTVYTWGNNQYGQLGVKRNSIYQPTPQKLFLSEKILSIYCGGFHNVVITTGKNIYVWGWNEYGQLGVGNFDKKNKF